MALTSLTTHSERPGRLDELDQLRRKLGMSCQVVADRSGVSLPTVQRIMAGGYRSASLETLEAVARAVGASVALEVPVQVQDLRDAQARKVAERVVAMSQGTAALEGQGVGAAEREDAVRRLAAKLASGSGRKLWAEP